LINRAPLIAIIDRHSAPLAKRSAIPYVAQFNALREL
jgi:hypothetical protein